ncbi:MAG TPA: glutamate--tRNA ligase [Candidatus Paceibacterota bacterium]
MEASSKKPVRLRMAPSPTGHWHMGGVRTALFEWLFARKHGGSFILRIEDTDEARSDKQYEREIVEMLNWLGLDWDEGPDWQMIGGVWQTKDRGNYGPYRQTERGRIYRKYLEKLITEGKAYYCYCTKEELEAEKQAMQEAGLVPKYSKRCRDLNSPPAGKEPQVIRFKTPEVKIEFKDIIRGRVEFDASLFGDMVIARNLESPLYNFGVVVDDHEMQITHVIRGEEHLSNTPRQLLLQRAMGLNEPTYGHLPLILAPNRSKLSKRFSETSIVGYREMGYLPQAIINYLVLLGWHPSSDNREIFSLAELIQEFDLKRVQKAGAIFSQEKLDWVNSQYLKRLSEEELIEKLTPLLESKRGAVDRKILLKLVALEKDRIKTLSDFVKLTELFFELPEYDGKLLMWRKSSPEEAKDVLRQAMELIQGADEDNFETKESVAKIIAPLLERHEKGAVFWPIRVALSGSEASPDPLDIAAIIGKHETARRLKTAIDKMDSTASK